MSIHRYGLISDTHGHLHPGIFQIFDGVEGIFHAGDVGGGTVLTELETIAPTIAVAGNCDPPGGGLPFLRVETLPFGILVLTHSHLLDASGRDPESLARHFSLQSPKVIVFGHTHRAYAQCHDGIWVVNPGPAGKPRFRDKPSVVVMTWDDDSDRLDFEFTPLEWKRK